MDNTVPKQHKVDYEIDIVTPIHALASNAEDENYCLRFTN